MSKSTARWRNLTHEQQLDFGNGCGAARSWFDPPELIFAANCRQHDFYYMRGGRLRDKLRADFWFGWLMLKNALSQTNIFSKVVYAPPALIYWAAVFFFGWFAFNWGRPRSLNQIIEENNRHE